MKARFVIALLAVAMLCASTLAQEEAPEAWYKKGIELYYQESFKEALDAFNHSLEMNPQYFDAWLYKGAALDMIAITSSGTEGPKAFEESLKAYDEAIEIDPQNATAWMFKGGALDNIAFHMAYNFKMSWPSKDPIGFFNQSIQAFDNALELDSESANAWHGKGVALIHLGRYEESQNLGTADEITGLYDEALKSINRAIEIDPNTPGARENKASLLEIMGRHEEARKTANTTQDLAQVLYNRAGLLANQGKEDEALEALDKAIELNPKHADAWHDKGMILEVLGRNSEADAAYDKAKELGYQE
ncbi:MAG: tetratricopeptide repeat protein [Methanothrix sp.]|nr:tetratricopeptide repeat protein [Methanothrix sp.]